MIFAKQNTKIMKTNTVLLILKFIVLAVFLGLLVQLLAILAMGAYSLFSVEWNSLQSFIKDATTGIFINNDSNAISTSLLLIGIIGLLPIKVYLSYLLWKVLNKMNLNSPFTKYLLKLIVKIGYVSLITGVLLSIISFGISSLNTPDAKTLSNARLENSGFQYLFFALIIFVITQVFKRGVEMQEEHELLV